MTPDYAGRVIDAAAARPDDVAEEVARTIMSGGTVILPNDTSYLIGCDPYDSAAIDRIYAAKGRPDNRPLTMHVATASEFLEYAPDNPLATLAAQTTASRARHRAHPQACLHQRRTRGRLEYARI